MSDLASIDSQVTPPLELEEAWTRHPEIVKIPHPALRQHAKPVTRMTSELRNLIARMIHAMREARGLGLAANQVGALHRILIYDTGDGLKVLINPRVIGAKGEQLEPPEGCLSIPGLQGVVKRAQELRVRAFDERLRPVTLRVKDLESRVIQHEIDHLDGVLFIDRAEPDTLVWLIGGDEEDDNEAPRD